MKANKRSIKYNVGIIVRAYTLIIKQHKRYIFWNILSTIYRSICSYFPVYMSALLVNEIAYSSNPQRLMRMALFTISGIFIIAVVGRLISGRSGVYGSDAGRREQIFFFCAQNKLKYSQIEDPEIHIKKEQLRALRNTNGAGLLKLLNEIGNLTSALINLIMSITLTISMFEIVEERQLSGFLGVINSHWSILIVTFVIFANAFISVYTTNTETRCTNEEYQKDIPTNISYQRAMNSMWGPDIFVSGIGKIITSDYKERWVKPEYEFRVRKIILKYSTIKHLGNHFMTVFLYVFIAAKVYIGTFGIGSFVLYRATVERFISALSSLASVVGSLWENNDALEKTFEFLDLPKNINNGSISLANNDNFDIEFRNVSFKYPRSEVWVLKNVSTKFNIGSKFAIVGINGSGKSTFIKLLCRLYDPTEGQILLNGVDIKYYKYDEYIKLFSVVFQDYKLFSFSIAENVSGSLNYDEKLVMDCLKKTGLDQRILSLEKGIETSLYRNYEDDGIDISGGEAQKIAMARALYKGAPFLILDEPTAALDPLSEAEIYSHFDSISENKTAIYISHRLSSCRFCEKILVFDDGRIVQSGSHNELVKIEGGKYFELWHAQSQYYI